MVKPLPGSSELGDDLPDELRHRIKAELQPGERLLWSSRGMSRGRTVCSSTAVGLFTATCFILSGLVFVAFFGRLGPPGDPASILIFGLGIAALIVFITWLNERLKGHSKRSPVEGSLYALTDRRAIIWKPALVRAGSVEVITIARGQAQLVRRVENPDGSGDVLFAVLDAWFPEGERWMPGGFEGISDVRRVEELVRRTLFSDPTQAEL